MRIQAGFCATWRLIGRNLRMLPKVGRDLGQVEIDARGKVGANPPDELANRPLRRRRGGNQGL